MGGSGQHQALAESWDGSNWSIQPTPSPAGTTDAALTGVSCTAPSACTAVGSYTADGVQVTLAEAWDGSSWSIQPTPFPGNATTSNLSAVSCASPNACTAVGSYTGKFGAGQSTVIDPGLTLVERWDGTSWSLQPPPPPNIPSEYGTATPLMGVSCTAPTACTVVGSNGGMTGWNAASWNGTSWSTYSPPSPPAPNPALVGVSCTSPAACTAVGNYNSGIFGAGVAVDRWDGTSWSMQPTPSPALGSGSNLAGVSCASALDCTAVGHYVSADATNATLVEHWDGNGWSIQPSPAAPAIATSSVSLTADAALLNATGTTGFLDASVYFQYARMGDPFCGSGGATGTPSSTSTELIPGASTPFAASATLAGLSRGSTYCFRFVATNSFGTSIGTMGSLPFFIAPEAYLFSLTTTGARTATVAGSAFAALQETSVDVDYDLASSSFCTKRMLDHVPHSTAPVTLPADLAQHNLSLSLTGLTPGDRYCAAIVARNQSGVTSTPSTTFTAGVPNAGPGIVTAIGRTAANVTGSIDPVAQTTTYHVAFATARSTWCRNHGSRGVPAFSTKQRTLRFRDLRYHSVEVAISGLRPGRSYCLALVVRNGSGTTVAAVPSLPASPKLTVSIFSAGGVAPAAVTSSPNGISCPGRCSASFPRGAHVRLRARPATGWRFLGWNPNPCDGYSCSSPLSPACSNSVARTCAITLSDRTTVTAVISTQSTVRPSCVLTPDRRQVQNLTLSLSATCTAPVAVTVTGRLTELSTKGKQKIFALRPIRRTGSKASWHIRLKLPRSAVNALRTGGRESVTISLTYSNRYGRGRTAATIPHLTTRA